MKQNNKLKKNSTSIKQNPFKTNSVSSQQKKKNSKFLQK
jgi:hypothetical protein